MKAVKDYERIYYKSENWTQPVMSANTQARISLLATNFNSSNLYILMNGVSNSDYICPTSTSTYGSTFTIMLDYYIKLSQFTINYYAKKNVTYGLTSLRVTALVDNMEIDITPNYELGESGWYTKTSQVNNLITNCVKIYCSTGGSPQVRIGEITLTGDKVEESTESDYDFYKDVPIYKIVKENDTYKAPRSWEKGQYYGN